MVGGLGGVMMLVLDVQKNNARWEAKHPLTNNAR
jgi:hypothetical protein